MLQARKQNLLKADARRRIKNNNYKQMSELDQIRQKKIEQLRARVQEQQEQAAEETQQLAQLEAMVKQYLTVEAEERYSTIKTAHPEEAMQLLVVIARALQAGQIRGKVNDAALKNLAARLSQKREITITRK